jgi:hypothetical protein
MGSELVSPASHFSYTEQFEEQFPYYLSIGMTYEQFWDGDCWLAKSYRNAHKLRMRRDNEQAWLIGRYVYDAVCAVSPLLHAFAKNGTTAHPYLEKPYPSSMEEAREREIQKLKDAAEGFRAFVEAKNAQLRSKEVNSDVRGDDRPITD